MVQTVKSRTMKRAGRTRNRLKKVAGGRPRLSVFRSDKNISAQIIDDRAGRTIASCSTLDKDVREAGLKKGSDVAAASEIGRRVAEKAIEAGVKDVVFDRGGYIYHGRVKALAEAAREAGLNF